MLTLHWKDFEQEPFRKDFLKHLASKTYLAQFYSTNHSDYRLLYELDTNGDRDSSTSNLPSFMVH